MEKKIIGILVGSLRKNSFSETIARHLSGLLADQFDVKLLDISNLTMYNQDLDMEEATPQAWIDFRREVKAVDAVLFVTPEYNRSIPAVLKNALDIASRPYGQNSWNDKPGAVVSFSPGNLGGFGANHHLRQIATCLNIHLMGQPEAYIGNVAAITDSTGVTDEGAKKFLLTFANAFAEWINKF